MNTKPYLLAFLMGLLTMLSSCKKEAMPIHVDYISGEAKYSIGDTSSDLSNIDHFYSNEEQFELNLENGFVLLKMDSVSLILPKEGKSNYTMSEILKEFKYCEQSVNQKYLGYVTKNIRKTKDEPEDDLETTGIVSRGTSFIQSIAPSGSCSYYEKEVHFAWNTNMLMDSLSIHVIDEEQQLVSELNIEPGLTDKAFSRGELNIADGGTYYWQLTRLGDSPSYNAWNSFDLARQEEVDELNSQLQTEFSLSDETIDLVVGAMSCGCN